MVSAHAAMGQMSDHDGHTEPISHSSQCSTTGVTKSKSVSGTVYIKERSLVTTYKEQPMKREQHISFIIIRVIVYCMSDAK